MNGGGESATVKPDLAERTVVAIEQYLRAKGETKWPNKSTMTAAASWAPRP